MRTILTCTALSCLWLTPSLLAAEAQDLVITTRGEEHRGTVTAATDLSVVMDDDGGRELRFPARQVREVRFGADPRVAFQAQRLIRRWQTLARDDGRIPSGETLQAELAAGVPPAVLARLDELLVAVDPGLVVPATQGEGIEGTLEQPLLEALVHLGWWRSHALLLDMHEPHHELPTRYVARDLLRYRVQPEAIPVVAGFLGQEDPVYGEAQGLLSRLVKAGHFDEVLEAVREKLRDDDPRMRELAWHALQGGYLERERWLVQDGVQDPVPAVRRAVVSFLGQSSDPEDTELIVEVATRDEDLKTVWAALECLGRVRQYAFAPDIIDLAESAENDRTRELALRALQRMTGAAYGERFDRWESWWELEGAEMAEAEAQARTIPELRVDLYEGQNPERLSAMRMLAQNPVHLPDRELWEILGDVEEEHLIREEALRLLELRCRQEARGLRLQEVQGALASQLLDLLEMEDAGPTREAMYGVLTRIAGTDLGRDLDRWREWFVLLSPETDRLTLASLIGSLITSNRDLLDRSLAPGEGQGGSPPDPERQQAALGAGQMVSAALRIVGEREVRDLQEEVQGLALDDQVLPLVRRDALQALGRIGQPTDEALLRALVRLLEQERDVPVVATAAGAALERITGHTTCGRSISCWNAYIDELGLPPEEE